MKKKSIIAGLLLSLCSVAGAATVNVGGAVSAGTGLVAVAANGTVLSSGGYYIAVGSFATVPTVLADFSNLYAAVDSMSIFATALSPTVAGNTLGTIVGSFVNSNAGTANLFNGKQIYLVVGNGSSRANSTDFAILTTATNVLFPADVTGTGTSTVTFSSITNSVVLTNAGSEIDSPTGTKDRIQLVSPVPEPSAALLGAIGALGLLRRRRI